MCDGLCSADRFVEFQSWLIALGREALAPVAASPDALAEVPAVRTLLAVGVQSWPDAGPFTGEVWDLDSPVEAAVRLPRLWELTGGVEEAA